MGDDHQDDANTNEKRLEFASADGEAELIKASKSRRASWREEDEQELLCREFDEAHSKFDLKFGGGLFCRICTVSDE